MKQVSESIFVVEGFWSASECQNIVDQAERFGKFSRLPEDEKIGVAGLELRVNEFSADIEADYRRRMRATVIPALQAEFQYTLPTDDDSLFRHPFVLKYTMSTQQSMNLHHDMSLLSVSVLLNSEFTGCNLVFPRQHWSNLGVNVGDLILFPGMITHPHFVTALTSGQRYSLTGWLRGPDLSKMSLY